MAYNGSVELISGITPKNNGTFALVDASAVRVNDEMRLDAALQQGDIDARLLQSVIKNTRQEIVITNGAITGVNHVGSNNHIVREDTFDLTHDPMVETRILDTGETLTISTDLTTLTSTINYTPASA